MKSMRSKPNRKIPCPHCKIFVEYNLHDINKCVKIHEIIDSHNGDFIKLLQEGILCCWYCRMYFADYKKLYEHHIQAKHCFHKDKCKICKFYMFINSKLNSSVQGTSIPMKNKTIQNSEEDAIENNFNQNIYSCLYCNKKFKCRSQFQNHKSTHEKDENQLKCLLCERVFKKESQMQIHMRVHTNERPYKCDMCPSAFTVAANLRTHRVYKHTDDKPFVCEYEGCNAKFKLLNLKRQHEKSHLPANIQCEMCGNYFKTKFVLLKHQQNMHVDIKNRPYACEVCQKQFFKPGHLVDHKRIHTGEKPYACDICSKFFRKRYTLSEHKKLHSNDKKYICRFCGREFKQAAGYWWHMKRHHIIS